MYARASRAAAIKALTGPVVGLFAVPVAVSGLTSLWQAGALAQFLAGLATWGAVSAFHYQRTIGLFRSSIADEAMDLHRVDTSRVRTLIVTADVTKGAGQAVGTLMNHMTNLQAIHLIVGYSDATDQAHLIDVLTDHARGIGLKVAVSGRPIAIAPFELLEDDQTALRRFLAPFADTEDSWLDVTGGTATMSVAATRAANAVGLHTCYTAMDRSKKPEVFYGVVDITA